MGFIDNLFGRNGKQNDKNRGGKLENDGVCRRCHLIGHRKQGICSEDAQSSQSHPAVKAQGVLYHNQVNSNDHQRDGGTGAVDGHAVPGDDLHTQTADAVKQGRYKHAQRSSLTLRHLIPPKTKSPLPVSTDRGHNIYAVPPLVRFHSREKKPLGVRDSCAVTGVPGLSPTARCGSGGCSKGYSRKPPLPHSTMLEALCAGHVSGTCPFRRSDTNLAHFCLFVNRYSRATPVLRAASATAAATAGTTLGSKGWGMMLFSLSSSSVMMAARA